MLKPRTLYVKDLFFLQGSYYLILYDEIEDEIKKNEIKPVQCIELKIISEERVSIVIYIITSLSHILPKKYLKLIFFLVKK